MQGLSSQSTRGVGTVGGEITLGLSSLCPNKVTVTRWLMSPTDIIKHVGKSCSCGLTLESWESWEQGATSRAGWVHCQLQTPAAIVHSHAPTDGFLPATLATTIDSVTSPAGSTPRIEH